MQYLDLQKGEREALLARLEEMPAFLETALGGLSTATIRLVRSGAGEKQPSRELRYMEVWRRFPDGWKSIWGMDAEISLWLAALSARPLGRREP